jgi:formaldehyde-activating enzyme involved in methanogenesis
MESLELNNIIDCIYIIRGNKIILDKDIARLYNIETKALKQAVKRNIERFPDDFMF